MKFSNCRIAVDFLESQNMFLVDMSVKLCISPDVCALDVMVFDKTKLMLPICDSNYQFQIQSKIFNVGFSNL